MQKPDKKAAYFQMLGELLPYLLHELNNPLTALQAYGFIYAASSRTKGNLPRENFLADLGEISARLVETSGFGSTLIQTLNDKYSQKLDREIAALIKLLQIKFRRIQTVLEDFEIDFFTGGIISNLDFLILIYTILEIFHQELLHQHKENKEEAVAINIKIEHATEPAALQFVAPISAYPEKMRSARRSGKTESFFQPEFLPASSLVFLQISQRLCKETPINLGVENRGNQRILRLSF